jgi:hypothetical protein
MHFASVHFQAYVQGPLASDRVRHLIHRSTVRKPPDFASKSTVFSKPDVAGKWHRWVAVLHFGGHTQAGRLSSAAQLRKDASFRVFRFIPLAQGPLRATVGRTFSSRLRPSSDGYRYGFANRILLCQICLIIVSSRRESCKKQCERF